jgi:hypothetical protein
LNIPQVAKLLDFLRLVPYTNQPRINRKTRIILVFIREIRGALFDGFFCRLSSPRAALCRSRLISRHGKIALLLKTVVIA